MRIPSRVAGLIGAASAGNDEVVAHILRENNPERTDGIDVNSREPGSGKTALHYAVANNITSTVALLLSLGASTRIADVAGATALHVAVRLGRREVMQLLLDHGADLVAVDRLGRCPHLIAAQRADVETLAALLDRRRDLIDATDHSGRTALRFAAELCAAARGSANEVARATATLEALVDRGADPNVPDRTKYQETVLTWCARTKQPSMMKKLLDDLGTTTTTTTTSGDHGAKRTGGGTDAPLQTDDDADCASESSATSSVRNRRRRRRRLLLLLVQGGGPKIDVSVQDASRRTALDWVALGGRRLYDPHCLKLLVQHGAETSDRHLASLKRAKAAHLITLGQQQRKKPDPFHVALHPLARPPVDVAVVEDKGANNNNNKNNNNSNNNNKNNNADGAPTRAERDLGRGLALSKSITDFRLSDTIGEIRWGAKKKTQADRRRRPSTTLKPLHAAASSSTTMTESIGRTLRGSASAPDVVDSTQTTTATSCAVARPVQLEALGGA